MGCCRHVTEHRGINRRVDRTIVKSRMSIGFFVAGFVVHVFAAPRDAADPVEEVADTAAAAGPAVMNMRPITQKSDAEGSSNARKSDVMTACGVPNIPCVPAVVYAAAVDAELVVGHGVNGKLGRLCSMSRRCGVRR